MAAVHGDWWSLHWGDYKCKPVYDILELLQPFFDALDRLAHSSALEPEVTFVLLLCKETAAVARAAPLPLRSQSARRGLVAREKSQEVQNLPTKNRLRSTAELIDSTDEVQFAVTLLLVTICQP